MDAMPNDRRRFMTSASALGAAALLGVHRSAAADPRPETTRVRLVNVGGICLAPEYLAEEFLRLEGFSQIEYVEIHQNTAPELLVANRADITAHTAPGLLPDLDAGKPLVALAGLHRGCMELFVHERVRAIRDLRGKRIVVSAMGTVEYYFAAAMVSYVGMDPHKDIEWVDAQNYEKQLEYFVDGKVDAMLAAPPDAQDLRAKKIGRVILDTGQDRPWNQYFCCLIAARRDFVARNPVATKRAIRAILKASDLCAREPERAAKLMVAKGFEPRYEVALAVLKSLSYERWRTYDAEDSLRFFGVRLHEAGLIRTNPNKLIAQGTDWRFLNELKRELKG